MTVEVWIFLFSFLSFFSSAFAMAPSFLTSASYSSLIYYPFLFLRDFDACFGVQCIHYKYNVDVDFTFSVDLHIPKVLSHSVFCLLVCWLCEEH